jgi:nucleoside-diphosphate-sugar epimerase
MSTLGHNFILTGATGVLGSNIFYELLEKIALNHYQGQVVLLLRSKPDKTIQDRFQELLNPALIPNYLQAFDLKRLCDYHVVIFEMDLKKNIDLGDFFKLSKEKYILIHCAASVNLGNHESVFEEIKHTNYLGTLNLIQRLLPYIDKVSYISTAFAYRPPSAYGEIEGSNYRNHYEKFKAQVENEIVQICEGYGLQWQILRPSIICGRLIDYPKYVIARFLVFYMFGSFFYRAQKAYGDVHVRILINPTSGLNLIPVDFAAKAIVRAVSTPIQSLNIVDKHYLPNTFAIPTLLGEIGYRNFELVDVMPDNQNVVEKLYYRTVGPQLSEYLLAPNYDFDMHQLNQLMFDVDLPSLQYEFAALCSYAVSHEFKNILA